MEKTLNMGKVSATGSFHLFIGKVLSTLVMAGGSIIVGIFILESDYGLYAISLIPAMTLLLFQDWGTGSALIKFCASLRVEKKEGALRETIIAGVVFNAATGIALTVFSLLSANFIATSIFNEPDSAFLIVVASVAVFFTSLFTVSQSVFVGFERMKLSTIATICHAVIHGLFSPLLVYVGYGALGAVVGSVMAYVVAGVFAVFLMYFAIFRKLRGDRVRRIEIFRTLRPMLSFGLPLAIATILSGGLLQFYQFMMAAFVDTAMIGNYRIATNFAVLLGFFIAPIATVLFPAFSKIDSGNEGQILKRVFSSSVKYTALFLAPATLAMVVLSEPIIGTIYGDKWLSAPAFLSLYVIQYLLYVIGSLSMISVLSGLGETRMVMKLNVLTLCVGVPMAIVLIPLFEIIGLILCILFAGVPSIVIGLHWIWKRYGIKADFGSSAKIFLASSISALAAYLFLAFSNVAAWVMLVGGGLIFLAMYLITAPLIGAIVQADIDNLRAMFSGMGLISKLLEIPLSLIEKPLKIKQRLKGKQ
jgi:O-antigen/teichoic acid export membrane protein